MQTDIFSDPPASQAEPLSVAALNRLARQTLESRIPLLWVKGEISGLTVAASGHVYFNLKDELAQVRCTMWRAKAQLLAFRPENGMHVKARCTVTLYEARGDFQLNVETLRPEGSGSLFEAFNRLKQKLAAEGLFDPAARAPLPAFPKGVGIVTSPQAAALRDVVATLRRRAPNLPIVLYPAPVQGGTAPALLIDALEAAARRAETDGIDVLLLVRGGGNIEDLWAFNDEALARAIRRNPLPVVTGIGHETDFSIADFVADMRASTPTAAAELISAGFDAAPARLDLLERRLRQTVAEIIDNATQRLDRCSLRLIHPKTRLHRAALDAHTLGQRLHRSVWRQFGQLQERQAKAQWLLQAHRPDPARLQTQLDLLQQRMRRGIHNRMQRQSETLEAFAQHLQHLSPNAVLTRGYSIVRDEKQRIVYSITGLVQGQRLAIQMTDGRVDTRIEQISPPLKPTR